MPLAEQIALESLEATDKLGREAAHFGEVFRDRQHLCAQALLNRVADTIRERRLENRRRFSKGLDLIARPLEGGLNGGWLEPALGCLAQPLSRPFDRSWIHGSQR